MRARVKIDGIMSLLLSQRCTILTGMMSFFCEIWSKKSLYEMVWTVHLLVLKI